MSESSESKHAITSNKYMSNASEDTNDSIDEGKYKLDAATNKVMRGNGGHERDIKDIEKPIIMYTCISKDKKSIIDISEDDEKPIIYISEEDDNGLVFSHEESFLKNGSFFTKESLPSCEMKYSELYDAKRKKMCDTKDATNYVENVLENNLITNNERNNRKNEGSYDNMKAFYKISKENSFEKEKHDEDLSSFKVVTPKFDFISTNNNDHFNDHQEDKQFKCQTKATTTRKTIQNLTASEITSAKAYIKRLTRELYKEWPALYYDKYKMECINDDIKFNNDLNDKKDLLIMENKSEYINKETDITHKKNPKNINNDNQNNCNTKNEDMNCVHKNNNPYKNTDNNVTYDENSYKIDNDNTTNDNEMKFELASDHKFITKLDSIYVHCDLDAFYASCEELHDPSLRKVPLGVGSLLMLATSNYEARKYGVKAGMPGYMAKRLCPHLVIVKSDFRKYNFYSEAVMRILAVYDLDVEVYGVDEACLRFCERKLRRAYDIYKEKGEFGMSDGDDDFIYTYNEMSSKEKERKERVIKVDKIVKGKLKRKNKNFITSCNKIVSDKKNAHKKNSNKNNGEDKSMFKITNDENNANRININIINSNKSNSENKSCNKIVKVNFNANRININVINGNKNNNKINTNKKNSKKISKKISNENKSSNNNISNDNKLVTEEISDNNIIVNDKIMNNEKNVVQMKKDDNENKANVFRFDGELNFKNVSWIVDKVRKVIHRNTGLTISAGISVCRGLSKYASDINKPNGQYIIEKDFDNFLKDLKVDKINGIGKYTKIMLEQTLQIKTIGDLREKAHLLYLMLKEKTFTHLFRLSFGLISFDSGFKSVVKSHARDVTFKVTNEYKFLCEVLFDAARELSDNLEGRISGGIQHRASPSKNLNGKAGFVVTLRVRYSDFTGLTRQKRLARPISTVTEIYNEAYKLFCDVFGINDEINYNSDTSTTKNSIENVCNYKGTNTKNSSENVCNNEGTSYSKDNINKSICYGKDYSNDSFDKHKYNSNKDKTNKDNRDNSIKDNKVNNTKDNKVNNNKDNKIKSDKIKSGIILTKNNNACVNREINMLGIRISDLIKNNKIDTIHNFKSSNEKNKNRKCPICYMEFFIEPQISVETHVEKCIKKSSRKEKRQKNSILHYFKSC
ncbi:hypothetical protein COBT_001084 [Conglomerata obtusa]